MVLVFASVSDFAIPWPVIVAAILVFYTLLAVTIVGVVKILNDKYTAPDSTRPH